MGAIYHLMSGGDQRVNCFSLDDDATVPRTAAERVSPTKEQPGRIPQECAYASHSDAATATVSLPAVALSFLGFPTLA